MAEAHLSEDEDPLACEQAEDFCEDLMPTTPSAPDTVVVVARLTSGSGSMELYSEAHVRPAGGRQGADPALVLLAAAFLALVVGAMADLSRVAHGFSELEAITRLLLEAFVVVVAVLNRRSSRSRTSGEGR